MFRWYVMVGVMSPTPFGAGRGGFPVWASGNSPIDASGTGRRATRDSGESIPCDGVEALNAANHATVFPVVGLTGLPARVEVNLAAGSDQ